MPVDSWPFSEPRRTAAVTTARVVDRRAPIRVVQHLAEGEGWTFLDGEAFDSALGRIITMEHVYELDPSIGELADMPQGWVAIRDQAGAPWRREPDDV